MSIAEQRYRPRARSRGEDTRQRILETAIEVFANEGYEGATTRALAERAEVNLPAIQYYFGSKEGLFRAAVEHIASRIDEHMAAPAERAAAALVGGDGSRRELMARLYALLDALTLLVIDGDHPASWALFITRAQIERSAALDSLHACFLRLTVAPCAALIGRLVDRPADDDETLLRTLTILGQILVFHKRCGNRGVERLLGFEDFTPDRVRAIQALVRRQTAAILRAVKGAKP